MINPHPLEPGTYYHIYNRGNNRENIFVEERNYLYFMKLYAHHVSPIADTYAYCLLRNHFHFLVRIKNLTGSGSSPSKQFSNLFNAYAKAFNIAYSRTGTLFQRPFGRIAVTSEAYFGQLTVYIHRNPQKHGFVSDFRDWPYSSYRTLLSDLPTEIMRHDVLEWFGGRINLEQMHRREISDDTVLAFMLDDLD